MRLEPNVKNETSLKTRLIKYGGGGIAILSILGIALWLYFQMGDQEQSMALTGSNPPANDTKAAAEWLTDLYEDQSASAAFTTENATSDAETGSCFSNGTQNGVWFKFQALYSDATITVKTGGSLGTATNLEVVLLDDSNNEEACGTASGNNNVTLNPTGLTQDDWYYVLVDHASSSDVGTFTVYINNVSPTKYYTRDKGDWDDNSTWSTSGYNGSTAGSQPTKANVVFIKDINGDLKVDGITAECAGIVMTSGNKKSALKIVGNGTLNVWGRFHLDGSGDKEMDLMADEATIYIQDEFLLQKSGGQKEFIVDFKKSDVNVERDFSINHSNQKGGEFRIEDNSTLDIGDEFIVYNQGGDGGMEVQVKNSDITVSGNTRFEYNNGSGDVIFDIKENSNISVGGDFAMEKNGGSNKLQAVWEKNVNLSIGGDASFKLTGGSSDFSSEFKDNVNIDVTGDVLVRETGGSNVLTMDFGKKNQNEPGNLTVGGDFKFGADNGSNSTYKLDIEIFDNSIWEVKGNVEHLTSKGKLVFDDGSAQLKLTGSGQQNLTGESDDQKRVDYQTIIINNSYTDAEDTANSIILQGPITLEERLDLTDGRIRSTSTSILTLERNLTLNGGSEASYVDGPLRKVGSTDFEYPVGDEGVYAPMELYNQSDNSSNNEFEVSYINQMYSDTSTDNSLSHVSSIEYWDVTKINGTGNLSAHLRLSWTNGENNGISDLSDLSISHYTGSEWTSMEPTSTSGTPTNGSINTTYGVGTFGQFTFGSLGGGNVLPIKLKSFEAKLQAGNSVLLTWETSQEINNDYFTLERSIDGKTYVEIGQVEGAGNSDVEQRYSFIDENPESRVNYYRLKQTDFDGKFEYFPVEQVSLEREMDKTASLEIIEVYPVPFRDQFTIELDAAGNTSVNISLVSMNGSRIPVTSQSISAGKNTVNSGNLSHLPKGTYILTINTPNEMVTKKILKASN